MKIVEENLGKDEWNILYSLEKMSNHPLAEAIVRFAEDNVFLHSNDSELSQNEVIKKFKNIE
jgi:cation transport ATPase